MKIGSITTWFALIVLLPLSRSQRLRNSLHTTCWCQAIAMLLLSIHWFRFRSVFRCFHKLAPTPGQDDDVLNEDWIKKPHGQDRSVVVQPIEMPYIVAGCLSLKVRRCAVFQARVSEFYFCSTSLFGGNILAVRHWRSSGA
jgi:hypothetical protein